MSTSHFEDELINGDRTIFEKLFEYCMILVPTIVLFAYSFVFVVRGASPKYYFYRPLKWIFFIHLALGFIEYILFFIIFFYTTEGLVIILGIFNIFHSISIFFMCIGVSGERYWMIPTYIWVAIIKLYYSSLLFVSPLDYDIFISLFYLHSFFAWGRIFFIVLAKSYLFENSVYSMSSTIGIMISLSQCLGQTGDYQYVTIFFILITVTSIIIRKYGPRWIVDNDQTNDSLYNIFNKNQIETIISKYEQLDSGINIEINDNDDDNNISDIVYLKKFRILISVLFDANGDDHITVEEFSNIFCKQMGYNMDITTKLWNFIDQDKKGWICINQATKVFADDNPHFEVDYLIDKIYKYFKEIHAIHVKKDHIRKEREKKINQEIKDLVNQFK